MSYVARRVAFLVCTIVVAFAVGNASGLLFYPHLFPADIESHDLASPGQASSSDVHASDEHAHLELTEQAVQNLDLQLGKASRGDFWKSLTIPGEIVEVPGKSRLSVSAAVTGVVEDVFVRKGQALAPGDELFTLRITDEALATSQSKLLRSLARQENVRQEIQRLNPLTQSGTVSGQRQRELEYELSQLQVEQTTMEQEIRAHGLPEEAVADVVRSKTLATTLVIRVPEFVNDRRSEQPSNLVPITSSTSPPPADYSVETISVHSGKTVQRGEDLCLLAYHAELYVQGQAFESDAAALAQVIDKQWLIVVEFGHEHHATHAHVTRRELPLLHVDNHIDAATQTQLFYMSIDNEVVQSAADDAGRLFQQWQFKPGQRVHLKLPLEHWVNQVTLPRDAVVVEGPNAFVFVEHPRTNSDPHDHAPGHSHPSGEAHEEPTNHVELELVPVRLLHRDDRTAVLADDGQIPMDRRIALNEAYKLQLALRMQEESGEAHHDHDH